VGGTDSLQAGYACSTAALQLELWWWGGGEVSSVLLCMMVGACVALCTLLWCDKCCAVLWCVLQSVRRQRWQQQVVV